MVIKKTISLFEIAVLLFGIIAFTSLLASLNAPLISAEDQEIIPGVTLPEETDRLGCCVDTDEGFCTPTSLRSSCEATQNGKFYEDEFCNIEGSICDRGCCILGIESSWSTKMTCEKQSTLFGIDYEFRSDMLNELECIDASRETEAGACVYEVGVESTCTFSSFSKCKGIGGEFYRNTLCSNQRLNSDCERQTSTGCLDGRDEIYWYDSCGNPENIYSSNRDASWNKGMILTKEQSCGASSPNINSESCGNCDYGSGSFCSDSGNDKTIKDGDAICQNLNCKSAPTRVDAKGKILEKENKVNGEAWCVYDGPIGGDLFGHDLIGSRHYRYVCSNGEVEVEPCQDFRGGICVQKTSGTKDSAICRVNTWEQCFEANSAGDGTGCEDECVKACKANPDCRVNVVDVDDGFTFTSCVPKYPPGFEIASSVGLGGFTGGNEDVEITESNGMAEDVCSFASQTCTSVWKKNCPGGWKCIENCDCHTQKFTEKMNNLCVSLGDCGVFANVMGKPVLDGARIKKDGRGDIPIQPKELGLSAIALSFLPQEIPAVGGIYDDVRDISSLGYGSFSGMRDPFLGNIGLNEISGAEGAEKGQLSGLFSGSQLGATLGFALGGGVAAAGIAVAGVAAYGAAVGVGLVGMGTGTIGVGAAGGAAALAAGTSGASAGTIGVAGIGAAGSGAAGAQGALLAATVMPFLIAVVVVIIAIMIIMYVSGCGKFEAVEVQYVCSPSGAPTEGKCSDCDGGKLKPCSKYKCESLGTNCRIINENTGDDKCISIGNFIGAPLISPFEEALNKTLFQYKEVNNNGFRVRTINDGCVEPFLPISLGVVTDGFARCRMGTEKATYDELSGSFLEGNLYSINHTLILNMPSVDAMAYAATPMPDNPEDEQAYQDALGEAYFQARKKAEDVNFYVKCKGLSGEENINDYRINFCVNPSQDLTPPAVVATAPATETIVGYSATEKQTIVFLTEPSDCKWGMINPNMGNPLENYNALPNEMICKIDGRSTGLLSYPCVANLTISGAENSFYFQCRDQPWLGENESRNVGNIFPYSLLKSESELKIDLIEPEGEIISGVEPLTVSIEAKTSGGAYGGASTCRYKISTTTHTDASFIKFLKTDSSIHSQPGLQFLSEDYTIDVRCRDMAGNTAEGQTKISLKLDSTPPSVARAFRDGENLKILTNEQATCFYSFSTCNFEIEEGIPIIGEKSTEHILDWSPDSPYYVRCMDSWGNYNSGCSIIVRPSQL